MGQGAAVDPTKAAQRRVRGLWVETVDQVAQTPPVRELFLELPASLPPDAPVHAPAREGPPLPADAPRAVARGLGLHRQSEPKVRARTAPAR